MLRFLQSPSAAERIAAAAEFIRSFAAATEVLLVGSSREAVDDLVRGLAYTSGATFGLHRFSFTQFAARLAIGKLAAAGVAPSSAVGAEALAVRAAYEAAMRNELPYFAPVTKFPGFARATAATIGDLRAAGIAAEKLEALQRDKPGLRLATMHRVKGLEFEHVIIVAVNRGIVPLEAAVVDAEDAVARRNAETGERSLLYVSLTRAKKSATITGYGPMSPFLPAL